ncbi:universal stress protein [Alcaligenaceae bacterium]|nr:universal stress protein [Alcaligenaceae bacterium]
MKSILVPVDGSDSSLRAVKWAMQEIQDRNNKPELHLLAVQPPIVSGNVTRFFSAQALEDYYNDEGQNALHSSLTLLADAGVAFTHHVAVGSIAPTIIDYAKENGCDHIAMGTRGLGSVSGMVLGSVTTKVLSMVDSPVTVIK